VLLDIQNPLRLSEIDIKEANVPALFHGPRGDGPPAANQRPAWAVLAAGNRRRGRLGRAAPRLPWQWTGTVAAGPRARGGSAPSACPAAHRAPPV